MIFKCAYESGICINYDEMSISTQVTIAVHPETKLSAALLGNDLGYRITYQDIHGSIRQLSYANSTKGIVTSWADGALVTNSTGMTGKLVGLSTVFVRVTNTTAPLQTIYPLIDGDIHSMTEDKIYNISQLTHNWSAGKQCASTRCH